LVIIDELGRGTSTHDGVAIASATLEHLIASQRCLSLFVTHYPQLCKLCDKFPDRLGAYFMAYAQEGGGSSAACGKDVAPLVPRITFLYKVVPGVAESSFGMNVAALAGLPLVVVGRASQRAADIERDITVRQAEHRSGAVEPQLRLLAVCREVFSAVAGKKDGGRLVELQKEAKGALVRSEEQ
jgi:DNA mismatch repair protein MSH3